METPILSVVVPTVGRPSLERTVRSLLAQGEWLPYEVILVGDSHGDRWAAGLPFARDVAARHPERLRYVAHDGGCSAWGQPQRNRGAREARGRYVWWVGDDDIALPGAFRAIARALAAREHDPRVLLFRWIAGWKMVLWHTAGFLAEDHIDAECIVCPNVPERLGTWTNRYQGDYDFIAETVERWGGLARVVWQPEVIAQAQPPDAEDWTLGGHEVPPVAAQVELRGVYVPVPVVAP